MNKKSNNRLKRNRFEVMDIIITVILVSGVLVILVPVLNLIAVSFTSEKEYLESTWIVIPKKPTLAQYQQLFKGKTILVGYKTTVVYVLIGVPLSLLLSTSLAYCLSTSGWPGRKVVLAMVLVTMIFNGGTVPLYLTMKGYGLVDSIWAVILPGALNTFNMILVYNYFNSLPVSLIESGRLDGANEWTILFRIVLPLAKPILATVALFVMVQYWNEYFLSMIFLKSSGWHSLQQVLRSIIVDTQITSDSSASEMNQVLFADGMKMAAVVVTMFPIMAVYPFLQKYFVKGVMVGAIKA